MTIALLATGNEIISGDTLNSNGQRIAHALQSEGLECGFHMSCSDNDADIYDSIHFLASKHDTVIITGGLGPTSDDRTRYALGRFLQTPLVDFPEALLHIQARLQKNMTLLNPGNKQQALFPAQAILLPNPNGTAMGCYYKNDDTLFVLLPGPPKECLPMFDHYVLPLLQTKHHHNKQLLKWRVFGVAESEIAQQLDEALKHIDCETGYRLETPYIECKVRANSQWLEAIKNIVEPIIAPYYIATTEKKASDALYEAIVQWQMPITIIDEVTGGLLQSLIQRPQSKSLLSFHNQKHSELVYCLHGLKEYWGDEKPGGITSLSIEQIHQQKSDSRENHQLPYRSSLVIYYAAEWLSFRLFHLINQLHQGVA